MRIVVGEVRRCTEPLGLIFNGSKSCADDLNWLFCGAVRNALEVSRRRGMAATTTEEQPVRINLERLADANNGVVTGLCRALNVLFKRVGGPPVREGEGGLRSSGHLFHLVVP